MTVWCVLMSKNLSDGYKIDKRVIMPRRHLRQRPHGEFSNAMRRLEVGDSFVYLGVPGTAYAVSKRVGIKIAIRRADGKGLGNRERKELRVWRVS